MSPAELSKSRVGGRVGVGLYAYHFKMLNRWGLLEIADESAGGEEATTRYKVTDRISQSVIDAAALYAISDVLGDIPEALAQWIEGPYIEDIDALVRAAGRRT